MSNDLPRESRSFMWFEDLGRDLAFGVRTLLKTPDKQCWILLGGAGLISLLSVQRSRACGKNHCFSPALVDKWCYLAAVQRERLLPLIPLVCITIKFGS